MKKNFFKATLCLCLLLIGCESGAKPESPVKAILSISISEKVVTNRAGSFDIFVTSNTNWTVESTATWLKPQSTSGTGNKSIKIDYEASEGTTRSGVLRFATDGVKKAEIVITQTEITFSNPIFKMPDPWVIKQGEYYYTCKAGAGGIALSKSKKLSVINGTTGVWKTPSDAGGGAVKPWNVSNLWAPELHYVDGKWYIYYAAGRPTSESGGSYSGQRSGVLCARTNDPMGSWDDLGMLYTGDNYQPNIVPTVNNTEYAIDLGVFKLNGQLYAVWSGNPSKTDGSQRLYIAKMLNPYTIGSSRVEISRVDQPWEKVSGTVNEGPAFLHNEAANKFFVVYSCNGSWTKHYRLGYLMLDTTKDPMLKSSWVKSNKEVFFRCDNTAGSDGVNGVGHCSFTKSPDDTEDWIVYHTKHRNDNTWGDRSTFIQKFTWNENGTPNFGTPVSWGEEIPVPSGEE